MRLDIHLRFGSGWNDHHPDWIAAVAVAEAQYPGYQISPANPFMVLRRPGDYA